MDRAALVDKGDPDVHEDYDNDTVRMVFRSGPLLGIEGKCTVLGTLHKINSELGIWIQLKDKVIAGSTEVSVLPVAALDLSAVNPLPNGTVWADDTSAAEWDSADLILFVGNEALSIQINSRAGLALLHKVYDHVGEIVDADRLIDADQQRHRRALLGQRPAGQERPTRNWIGHSRRSSGHPRGGASVSRCSRTRLRASGGRARSTTISAGDLYSRRDLAIKR